MQVLAGIQASLLTRIAFVTCRHTFSSEVTAQRVVLQRPVVGRYALVDPAVAGNPLRGPGSS